MMEVEDFARSLSTEQKDKLLKQCLNSLWIAGIIDYNDYLDEFIWTADDAPLGEDL
jgi:hypothetical protein